MPRLRGGERNGLPKGMRKLGGDGKVLNFYCGDGSEAYTSLRTKF